MYDWSEACIPLIDWSAMGGGQCQWFNNCVALAPKQARMEGGGLINLKACPPPQTKITKDLIAKDLKCDENISPTNTLGKCAMYILLF